MSKAKREKLREAFLAQLPANATEAETAVYLETQFCERVTLIVSRIPFTGIPNDADIIETVDGIRKRTVENRIHFYADRYPDAHIALFSTSDASDGMPIYIYN